MSQFLVTSRKAQSVESEERPWGSWHVLHVHDGYKVKRIHVKPHSRLSYQTHEHREEHWVIVRGTATGTVEGVDIVMTPGHSLDVPIGAKHRIANQHDEELVIIEVQLGSYTGEDDIVRLDDDYGR